MSPKKRRSQGGQQQDNVATDQVHNSANLPTQRKGKAVKRTSPPLSSVSFSNFIYLMGFVALAIAAFYSWRLTVLKNNAGGWWNLVMNKKPPSTQPASARSGSAGSGEDSVEKSISSLADALHIPPATLASAIASVVSQHAPPATLSSISEHEAPTASVVKNLVKNEDAEAQAKAEGIANKLGGIVGFDDGGIDLD
jgi:hypothetical protein